MTFCLALAVGDISLVVADTRVNLTHDLGSQANQDGPTDFTIFVRNPKYDLTVPFRFRKIRPVSNGWMTSAGDYLLGRKILDLIANHATASFAPIHQLLRKEYPRLKDEIQRQTGLSDEQVSGTVILGAPFGQSSAWIISFDQSRAKTNPAVGDYVTNWPRAVPTKVQRQAQTQFDQQLQAARSESSISGLARAAVCLVATAAEYANDVGIYSQVGITIGSSLCLKESYYLQGSSRDLLSMSESQLATILERLA